MKKVTKHGKKRLKQRNINQGRNGISFSARVNGKTKLYFEGDFYNYLNLKSSNGKNVKVYKNNIFIYSKNSHNLITTFPVPKRFMPIEQYLIPDSKKYVIENINIYLGMNIVIQLKNGDILRGIIINKIYNEINLVIGIIIAKEDNSRQEVLIDEIESVKLNTEDFNNKIIQEMGLKV